MSMQIENVSKCQMCEYNPSTHSFEMIQKSSNTLYYYTCPINGKDYKDTERIINHIRFEIMKLKENENWALIIDCSGLKFKHIYNYNLLIRIVKYLDTISENIGEIIILHCNYYFKILLKIMESSLSRSILSKITYDKNNQFSTLISMHFESTNYKIYPVID